MLRSLRQLQQQSAAAKGGGEAGAAERPMLFATMSGGVRHGGATTAFQCRMFQNRPDSVVCSSLNVWVCLGRPELRAVQSWSHLAQVIVISCH